MRFARILALATVFLMTTAAMATAQYAGKKVLLINSYHEGYGWSDGIVNGIKARLQGTGVELRIHSMDTKRHTDEAFKQQAGKQARAAIESYKPDVVIAADDNASKYVIEPYYKNAKLPVVFCGVNWDAGVYGYPYANATGMVEVTPVPQLLEQLRPFAKGDRVGFLGPDILTAHREAENVEKAFGLKLKTYFAKDAADWKKGFAALQKQADMLIIDSDGGLYKDQAQELQAFVQANTRIPTGSSYDFMAPFAMVNFAKVAEEQGHWSADAALKILSGTAPGSIPIVRNKEGSLILNLRIASKLNAQMSYDLIASADRVIE